MHELSIAEAVVAIVRAARAGAAGDAVELKVGHLRQVVPDALEFAFELTAAGHGAPRGRSWRWSRCGGRAVPGVRGRQRCSTLPAGVPGVRRIDVEVTRGEELLVDSLELEETMTTTGGMRHGAEDCEPGWRRSTSCGSRRA